MYNKNNIDQQAEREAQAMRRLRDNDSRQYMSSRYKRIRQQTDHNKAEFDKLFRA